jgi:polyisoprenoid-binding protein YceI
MKRTGLILMAGLIGFSQLRAEGPERKDTPGPAYSLDHARSTLYWEGSKPGGKHHGTIEVITGVLNSGENSLSGGSFEIDMSSIRNEDVENEGMRNKLVDHLKSEDFFFVEKYPSAVFTITDVADNSGPQTGLNETHMITGDLTIRGITHSISFPAEISMDNNMVDARTGEIRLDRTRWDVNHQSKKVFAELMDNFIEDEMIVKLDLHFRVN